MIRKEEISSRTNKGLDIIRHLYPDAGRVIDSGNLKQAFKVRNERTPSAHLKEYELWWVVTDFGDDQHGHNPISLWMREKNLGFTEACIDINTELMLGLGDIKADVNQPRFDKVLDASPDMKEGEWNEQLKIERVMKKYLLQYKLEVDSWERVVRTVSDIKASTGMEPVSVVGDESGITQLPRFEKDLPADPDMMDGEWYWEFNTDFSAAELEVFSPFVRPYHLASLNWHSVKWVGKCQDRKITKKYSTDTYPIFMRECTYEVDGEERKFYKKYEPMAFEKQYSFMYIGLKPRNFINGLSELKAAYTKFNEKKRSEWECDPLNEGKPYKEKKLWRVEICLDDRDAVLACSRCYHPVWMNSEISVFEDSHLAELSRFAEIVHIKWPRP